ncbi:MAG: cis-3-alkyl-4-acyloxetan-2-one decarboxylase [Thermoplasmata archaeon]|nr:cis-3-alkyl-4-acyloxetan-2-one decarboxylase [Thermoplasmata archaeon]
MALRNGWPDEALGELYPFEDQWFQLSDGTQMHYVEMGRAGLRRPTVLLLHGSPTWSFLYRDFIAPLSRHARVIAVDHVGFGRSDHPRDPRYHGLDRHIRNLEELVAGLGLKRVVPVVQDWGGPIGLGFAGRHPEKLAGLVVMNTWAFTTAVPMKMPRVLKLLRARGVGEWLLGRRNLYVEKFIPKYTERDLPEAVMAGYRHPFPTRASREALVQFVRMVPDRPGHKEWATMAEVEHGLTQLDVPARILWAENDPAFGKRNAFAFRDLLPSHPEPTFYPGAGHFLQEDIPGALVAEIRDFLRTL